MEVGDSHRGDPGWNISWSMLLAFVFPPLLQMRMKQRGPGPRITLLRQVFVPFAGAPVLFLPILAILLPLRDAAQAVPPVVPGLLLASGASLVAARWSGRRTLACGDEAAVADGYRRNFFLGLAFANAAALYAPEPSP